MLHRNVLFACLVLITAASAGCQTGDRVEAFIARIDALPPEERPKDWEHIKAMARREAPQAGEPAPDFTAKQMKGSETITLSEYHPGQPKVLIFGSYT